MPTPGAETSTSGPVTQAHRSHFYQRATDHGFGVNQIIGRVFAVNLFLAVLATISLEGSAAAKVAALLLGLILTGALLWDFGRLRR